MKSLALILFGTFAAYHLSAQGVGVGTATPHTSAALEVSSTTQGMLVPRMTTEQRTSIANAATGLLVFDMTTNSFWFKGSATWIELIDSSSTVVQSNGSNIYMGMTGNVGIGTNTPTSKLEVSGQTETDIKLSAGSKEILLKVDQTEATIASLDDIPLKLKTNNVENQLVLSPEGNVGISSSQPTSKLEVMTATDAQGIKLTDGEDELLMKLKLLNAEISTTTNKALHLNANAGTNHLTISPTGNIGIGKVGLKKLDVEGDAHISQKLGIGILNALYPLSFPGTVGEKISLNGASGNHFGIGLAAAQLRIYADAVASSIAFGRGSSSAFTELMRLTGAGFLGIGVASPNAPLQLANTVANRKIVLYENGNNDHQYFGFGVNPSMLRYQAQGDHAFFNGVNATTSNELMRLTSSGRLGIGVASPNAPLQLANALANRKIVLHENGNNDHQYFGFGVNPSMLRYQAQGDHAFFNGVNATTSNELMRVTSGGRMGVGIASPNATVEIARGTAPNGTLQVKGTTHDSYFNYSTPEDTYIRGGKAGAKVIINELGGLGNVGIGTDNPTQKLHVQGSQHISQKLGIGPGATSPNGLVQLGNTVTNRSIVMWENGNNDHEYFGFGINPSMLRYQAQGDHAFFNGVNSTTSNELMRITSNGRVGIGTSTPNAPLQFANTSANRKIVLYESHNNDHQFNGLGGSVEGLRYQTWVNEADHVFYSATSASESNQLMRISGVGNVSIGVTNTSEKLEVGGNVKVNGNLKIGHQIVTNVFNVSGGVTGYYTCNCPGDLKVLGGGWWGANLDTFGSYPADSGAGWTVSTTNLLPLTTVDVWVYAICARLGN